MATFCPSPAEDSATTGCAHAYTEAVCFSAVTIIRLEGPLHLNLVPP